MKPQLKRSRKFLIIGVLLFALVVAIIDWMGMQVPERPRPVDTPTPPRSGFLATLEPAEVVWYGV